MRFICIGNFFVIRVESNMWRWHSRERWKARERGRGTENHWYRALSSRDSSNCTSAGTNLQKVSSTRSNTTINWIFSKSQPDPILLLVHFFIYGKYFNADRINFLWNNIFICSTHILCTQLYTQQHFQIRKFVPGVPCKELAENNRKECSSSA